MENREEIARSLTSPRWDAHDEDRIMRTVFDDFDKSSRNERTLLKYVQNIIQSISCGNEIKLQPFNCLNENALLTVVEALVIGSGSVRACIPLWFQNHLNEQQNQKDLTSQTHRYSIVVTGLISAVCSKQSDSDPGYRFASMDDSLRGMLTNAVVRRQFSRSFISSFLASNLSSAVKKYIDYAEESMASDQAAAWNDLETMVAIGFLQSKPRSSLLQPEPIETLETRLLDEFAFKIMGKFDRRNRWRAATSEEALEAAGSLLASCSAKAL